MARNDPKPAKPKNSPLFPHACGQWAKKIRGKLHYFGVWSDYPGALRAYRELAVALHAGQSPEPEPVDDVLTVRLLGNLLLAAKTQQVESGELSAKTVRSYREIWRRVMEYFGDDREVAGIQPSEWLHYRTSLAGHYGPLTLTLHIQKIRSVCRWAYSAGHVPQAIRLGEDFCLPPQRNVRQDRQAKQAEHGLRMFEASEIRTMLAAANPKLTAMILLALNGGFGNTDLSELRQHMIVGSWIDHPRPKTAIPRRCPAWPETAEALQAWAAVRPAPADPADADRVFLGATGRPMVRVSPAGSTYDDVYNSFRKLLTMAGLQRPGVGFYALRHTVETIGTRAKDPVALNMIMGHVEHGMAAAYRERVEDSALLAVSGCVRAWLFDRS